MRVSGSSGRPSSGPTTRRPSPTMEAGRGVTARPARTTDPIALKFLEKNKPRVARGAAASASSAARRQMHEPLPSASGTGDSASIRNRSRGRPDQRLFAQELEAVQAGMVRHQRKLERACRNLRGELLRGFAGRRHLDQRVAPVEPGKNLGKEGFGVVVGNAEPDGSPQALSRQRGHRARFDLDNTPREVDQPLALRRQSGASTLLDEQRAAELILETADMHRDGGLRLVHALRGLGERAGIDDGEEGAQLIGVEHGG